MSEPFARVTSRVISIPRANIDTDQICPARFLKITDKANLADALFFDWRFTPDGKRREPVSFIDEPVNAAARSCWPRQLRRRILARACAVGAAGLGIRAIVSTSFADIFSGNALKNALLPIVVSAERLAALQALVATAPDGEWIVDLEAQTVTLPSASRSPLRSTRSRER